VFRRKIARLSSLIRSLLDSGQITTESRVSPLSEEADLDELNGAGWFRFLAGLAEQQADTEAGLAARGIFKAINDREKLIRERLGDAHQTWEDLVGPKHDVWQPVPGNQFYQAF